MDLTASRTCFTDATARVRTILLALGGRDAPPVEPRPAPPAGAALALAAARFDLNAVEHAALVLAVAAEWVPELAVAIRALADAPWPTVSLALAVAGHPRERPTPAALLDGLAVRDHLLELVGDGPIVSRTIRCAGDRVAVLAGERRPDDELDPVAADARAALVGAPAQLALLDAWARAWGRGPLVLCGPAGSGRRRWAHAAASQLGRPLVAVDARADVLAAARTVRRRARWHDALGFLELGADGGGDGEHRRELRAGLGGLAGLAQPLVIAVAPDDLPIVLGAVTPTPMVIEIGGLSRGSRAALWRHLVPELAAAPALADELAARFHGQSGDVAAAARAVQVRSPDERLDVVAARACRALQPRLAALATPIATRVGRDDLIVPARVAEELELALAWTRHRARVFEQWGFASRVGGADGLTMLFAGKPGTGKTMAAQLVAGELDRDLYRVDLARLVSKYIGETEKHLAEVFDAAVATGAVLLFDEADALFGRRGQVRDARDRYANLEVGYLLQRIERHRGISILTTNRQGDLDEAFLRRFQVAVTFPMPDVDERRRLWHRMLPPTAPRDAGLESVIDRLAREYPLSGGDILQAALGAAMLAASDDGPIGESHLARGVRRVLAKHGSVVDEALHRAAAQRT